jgi:hypothetical protein
MGRSCYHFGCRALGRPRQDVERYIREWKVVQPRGITGKGGRYVIDLDDLMVLSSAARLDDLHVPMLAIRTAMLRMRVMLRSSATHSIAVVYTGGDAASLSDNLEEVYSVLAHGASVQVIDAPAERAALRERLDRIPAPTKRGRPAAASAWVQERLASSSDHRHHCLLHRRRQRSHDLRL